MPAPLALQANFRDAPFYELGEQAGRRPKTSGSSLEDHVRG
jgi:hypothetical protein